MAKPFEQYVVIEVESYIPERTSGRRHGVHIRPCPGQVYPTTMHVECSKSLINAHPVGTRFRIRAKLTDREGGGEFLYSHYSCHFDVIP